MPVSYLISLDERSSDRTGGGDQAAIRLINRLLEEGVPVQWAQEQILAGERSYPAGTFFLSLPFKIESKIPCDVIVLWLEQQARREGLLCIQKTAERLSTRSIALVPPRIALFYDHTTYDNALMHFLAFRGMGFEAALVNAEDLLQDDDDPDSILARSNVFVMPGGSMHFSSFASEEEALQGLENIRSFIYKGGGYIGVCAGATEALMGNPHPDLNLVDASYHADWFEPRDAIAGDWEWRSLIGPLYLEIVDPSHPIMFGYSQGSPSLSSGPLVRMDYFGGPSIFETGDSVAVLARYKAPIDQRPSDRVKDIWGSAAIISSRFGSGRVVLFGPHPEWSGSCHRMYAQALYYAASKPRRSVLASYSRSPPATISRERILAIAQTAESALPILESCKRMCSAIVSLGAGDRSDPLGLWYDRTMLTYSEALCNQMREIAICCLELEQQYSRLSAFKSLLGGNAQAMEWIDQAQMAADQFFDYAESLSSGYQEASDMNGPISGFSELLSAIEDMEKKIREVDMPCAVNYAELFHRYRGLNALLLANQTEDCREARDELYLIISSSDPPGPLYECMITLRQTLDLMQYSVGAHLINLLNRADHARGVFSLYDCALKNLLAGGE